MLKHLHLTDMSDVRNEMYISELLEDIKNVCFWLNKIVEYNISDEILNDFKVNHRELLKNRILLKAMLSEIRK